MGARIFLLAKTWGTCVSINNGGAQGSMPEWLMGVDCKSTDYIYASSNLARPIHKV
jgi:hypothetical protein